MVVLAVWNTWIGLLASMLSGWREARRARRSLIVSRRDAGFIIVTPDRDHDALALPAGSPVPAALGHAARRGMVAFELPAVDVVVRRINVPGQAREFLAGIVHNQIERLSPWQAGQAVYGFRAEAGREDPAALDVQVLITSRAVVDAAREELAAVGLTVDRIVAGGGGAEAPVIIWSRLANASKASHEHTRRRVGLSIAGIVAATLVVSLWAVLSAASMAAETEDVVARTAALQRSLQAGRAPAQMASLGPAQRAWVLKETTPVAVVVLEALSAALPETAYLTELQLERTTVRISGLALEAPALVGLLQQSRHFADVHFFAPTTRSPDGSRFAFHIEARVQPRLKVMGE